MYGQKRQNSILLHFGLVTYPLWERPNTHHFHGLGFSDGSLDPKTNINYRWIHKETVTSQIKSEICFDNTFLIFRTSTDIVFWGKYWKRWGRQIPTSRLINSWNIEYGTNIFQKTWNEMLATRDHGSFGTLKSRDQETKKPRNQETKKPTKTRNRETKSNWLQIVTIIGNLWKLKSHEWPTDDLLIAIIDIEWPLNCGNPTISKWRQRPPW